MDRTVSDLELESEAHDSLPNVTDQAPHEGSERASQSSQESIAPLRDRVPTEKDREYCKHVLERELTRTLKLWRKDLENASQHLQTHQTSQFYSKGEML